MPPVAGTSRLVATYNGPNGATAANILHFVTIGGDFDQATGDDIATAWGAFFEVYSQQNWLIDLNLAWLDLNDDPPPELTVLTDGNSGDSTTESAPANVTACLSLGAATGGRSGRGRIYLPGISNEYIDSNLLTSGFISATIAAYQAFATDVATNSGWVPAVYSRTDGVSRIVQNVGMSNVVDTQRRRTQRLES